MLFFLPNLKSAAADLLTFHSLFEFLPKFCKSLLHNFTSTWCWPKSFALRLAKWRALKSGPFSKILSIFSHLQNFFLTFAKLFLSLQNFFSLRKTFSPFCKPVSLFCKTFSPSLQNFSPQNQLFLADLHTSALLTIFEEIFLWQRPPRPNCPLFQGGQLGPGAQQSGTQNA